MRWQPRVVPLLFNLILSVDLKTFKEDQKTSMNDDWRYSDEKMKLRQQALDNSSMQSMVVNLTALENQSILVNLYTNVPTTGYLKVM